MWRLLLAALAAGQDLVAITKSLRRAFPEEPWTFLAIDLGAGVRDDDPVFGILDADDRWRGVLVDGDPAQGPKMAERFPHQTTMVSYITPATVVDLVRPYINESKPDVVKLDIDSFDCSVLRVIFRELRPRIVVSEVNVKFAPDTSFALLNSTHCARAQPYDSEKRAWTYGCSLRFQHDHVAQPLGYALERLAWNNAVYVRRDLLAHTPLLQGASRSGTAWATSRGRSGPENLPSTRYPCCKSGARRGTASRPSWTR